MNFVKLFAGTLMRSALSLPKHPLPQHEQHHSQSMMRDLIEDFARKFLSQSVLLPMTAPAAEVGGS